MTEPQTLSAYFTYCKLQKNLDNKTLKAYQIDLKQFVDFYPKPTTVTRTDMELYIEHLMERYKASTVKRKIAALKAYYHFPFVCINNKTRSARISALLVFLIT